MKREKTSVLVRLLRDTHKRLKAIAEGKGISVNALIMVYISEGLRREKK